MLFIQILEQGDFFLIFFILKKVVWNCIPVISLTVYSMGLASLNSSIFYSSSAHSSLLHICFMRFCFFLHSRSDFGIWDGFSMFPAFFHDLEPKD